MGEGDPGKRKRIISHKIELGQEVKGAITEKCNTHTHTRQNFTRE